MLKILVTYLSVIILFQGISSNASVFFEMGEIIKDYQIHKIEYNDTLATFLSKHFGNLKNSHQQQHRKEHQQHKHPINDLHSSVEFEYISCIEDFVIDLTIKIEKTPTNFYYQDKFSTFEKQKIFQPPRV